MKTFRPAFARSICSIFGGILTTAFVCLLGLAFLKFMFLVQSLEPKTAQSPEQQVQWLIGSVAVIFGIGALLIMNSVGSGRGRYEMRPTELAVTGGGLWRSTQTLPYVEITRIDTWSGPIMRMLGLADLKVSTAAGQSTTLYGLRDAEEARQALLDRRDRLHEDAVEGNFSVAKTPQEMIFERLDRVLERIEHHLPPAGSAKSPAASDSRG